MPFYPNHDGFICKKCDAPTIQRVALEEFAKWDLRPQIKIQSCRDRADKWKAAVAKRDAEFDAAMTFMEKYHLVKHGKKKPRRTHKDKPNSIFIPIISI